MAVTGKDKVFVVNENTNTKYGGVDPTGAFQTVDELRGYKVYTALLTQSGGDNLIILNGGLLTIGVTYWINEGTGADFTNVGAPNNNNGTYFVATGTTPNSWGPNEGNPVSEILISNTGAPVVTVLENTIGDIWFTYEGVGSYGINNIDTWDSEKTWYSIGGLGNPGEFDVTPGNQTIGLEGSVMYLNTYNNDYSATLNNQLNNTPIEIRVYN